MLLSEVLHIAKHIKQNKNKHLNESFKSDFFIKLFEPFKKSSLFLEPEQLDKSDKYIHNTFSELSRVYRNLAYSNAIDDELLSDPKKREEILNTKYVLKKDALKTFVNKYILSPLKNTNYRIGISDLKNGDFVKITKEEAKKKPYKNCLQFWFDYYNVLKAICIDNKILVYVTTEYLYYKSEQPVKVNNDYIDKIDDPNECMKSYTSRYEFLYKAFTELPYYAILTNTKDIKEAMNCTPNIKNLQESGDIYYVYSLMPSAMEQNNITEKLKTRNEYKEFLKSQINLNIKNIRRYKEIIKINKTKNLDTKVENEINKVLTTCLDSLIKLKNIELQYLSDTSNKFSITNIQYLYVKAIYYDVKEMLKEYKIVDDSKYFVVTNIGICFLFINVVITLYINKCNSILTLINEYRQKKTEIDKAELISYIDQISKSFSQFKDTYLTRINLVPAEIFRITENEFNLGIEKLYNNIRNSI